MAISDETLKSMIRDYHGFEMSDEELALVRPELDNYMAQLNAIADLDLADVLSGRLLQADEGGQRRVQT